MSTRTSQPHWLALVLFSILIMSSLPVASGTAAEPIVRAVLFYSPTCGHCHKVMTEDLPPLKEKFGRQLDILEINTSEDAGYTLYSNALQEFQVPQERIGVPSLFIGQTHLVGSREIPEQLPGLIEAGLNGGGIGWPVISGLGEYILAIQPQGQTTKPIFIQRFLRDPLANSVAVIVLIGMIVSVVFVAVAFLRTSEANSIRKIPNWLIPVLCLLGLVIAGYLTYVEVANTNAVCGPVGDCNTVQQSPYAKLWGILPVGILGLIGYLAILAVWLVQRVGSHVIYTYTTLTLWGMAILGTLFATYLTFLEPFVIGATCAWCIGNAIVITLLMLAATPPAIQATVHMGDEEED